MHGGRAVCTLGDAGRRLVPQLPTHCAGVRCAEVRLYVCHAIYQWRFFAASAHHTALLAGLYQRHDSMPLGTTTQTTAPRCHFIVTDWHLLTHLHNSSSSTGAPALPSQRNTGAPFF